MKALLIISLFLSAIQASAVTYDNRGNPEYTVNEVEVLAACDATNAKVRNWYVLGRNPERGLKYGTPTLFTYSRGRLTPFDKQTDYTHVDDGRLYEIYDGYLTYMFNLTQPGHYSLTITKGDRHKIDQLPCRAQIDN